MSFADRRGLRPKTRLNGDNLSAVSAVVILTANDISVRRFDHSGAQSLVERIFNSVVNVLCCDSQSPFVRGWYGVVLTCLISRH